MAANSDRLQLGPDGVPAPGRLGYAHLPARLIVSRDPVMRLRPSRTGAGTSLLALAVVLLGSYRPLDAGDDADDTRPTTRRTWQSDRDLPPPVAVKAGKVQPLGPEDRRTLVRWIDIGCPIDRDRGRGWRLDEGRPTLTLAAPELGANRGPLTHLLLGMNDYGSGLDWDSLVVRADFPIDGVEPGENLAGRVKDLGDGRWELRLDRPIADLPRGRRTVSVKDRQGNLSSVERTFSVRK